MSPKSISGTFRFACHNRGHDVPPAGWFAVHPNWMNSIVDQTLDPKGSANVDARSARRRRTRRKLRGRWYEIRRSKSRTSIYRILQFDPTLPYNAKTKHGSIVLDWGGRAELANDEGNEVALEIRAVSPLRSLQCAWFHPNPSDRLALRLAVALGALSIAVSVAGLFKA